MTQNHSLLQVGLVDFAEPTLLLIAFPDSILRLAEDIASRHTFDLAVSAGRAHLRFIPIEHGDDRLSRDESDFLWFISAEKALEVVAELRGLAASVFPAHAYLDPQHNLAGVQIVASIGEYEPEKVFTD